MKYLALLAFLPLCLALDLFVPSKLNSRFNEIDKQPNEVPWVDLQPAVPYGPLQKKAEPCDPKKCGLPDCYCSGWAIPGGLNVSEVPQMVVFTFQNAVNGANYDLYMKLFNNRKNPNGCPRTGTFFVSHNYTNYWQVQSLYAQHHEIGDNTVTSPYPPLTEEQWKDQIGGQKNIISKWAEIPASEIRSFRAPFLTPGGDAMITAMESAKLTIDSSRTTTQFTESPRLLWPYTYDYASTQDCVVFECPEESHKGIWETPLVAWKCKDGTMRSSPVGCPLAGKEEAFNILLDKFMTHRNSSNRAPLFIVVDTAWVTNPDYMEATQLFLDYLDKFKDTYTVSVHQAIEWVRHPTTRETVSSFKPWGCSDKPTVCDQKQAVTCKFDASRRLIRKQGDPVYTLITCQTSCPQCFPFLEDPYGVTC